MHSLCQYREKQGTRTFFGHYEKVPKGLSSPFRRLLNSLLKNPAIVIARSAFGDEAISDLLNLLKPGLLRFARNDGIFCFSTVC
jgi:hypothetical protein